MQNSNYTKKLLFFAIVALCLINLVSCKKATYFTANKEVIETIKEGESGDISLMSDGNFLHVIHTPDWVDASIDGTTLKYEVEANNTNKFRMDSIVVGAYGMDLVIPVRQAYITTYISLSTDLVEFEKEGGNKTIHVDTDGGLIYVSAPESVNAKYSNCKLEISVPQNEGKVIDGVITLTSDQQRAEVKIKVKSSICLRCKGTGKIVCPKCKGLRYYDYDIDCEVCGGTGYPQGSSTFMRYVEAGNEPATGYIDCLDCGGTGL